MLGFSRRQHKTSDHPLARPAPTAEILQEIIERKGLECLQGLSEVLDILKTVRDLEVGRAFTVVDQVDRAGRPYWRRAANDHHAGVGKLTNYQANRIWVTVGEYIVQLAEAYESCLARCETGAVGSGALSAQVPRIIGRAVRLRVAAQSWDYVRYANQFGRWAELYRLYRLAELRGCADEKITLYRGGRLCTIEQEFMQALLLAVAAPHSMLPEQIDVADRTTAWLAHLFSLSGNGKANRVYYFDLASSNPPAREQPGIRPPVTARRFGPGDAQAELRRLAARADKGDLPLSEIGIDRHSQDIFAPTLQHLVRYWCDSPPERRHARRRAPQRISVSHGFEEIVAKVGNLPTAYPFVSAHETWLIENTGEGGIGAIVTKPHGEWAAIGHLIAFRYPEAGVWNLGIVRHLTEEKADRFLGIELVSRGGVAVSLRTPKGGRSRSNTDCLGVWLAGEPWKDGTITLLVPRGAYSPSSPLLMYVHDRHYLLSPRDLAVEGADYQIARYVPEPGGSDA
jgi:hypothetical protein